MSKKTVAKTTASFGAALSAMYAAPEAQAQIVPVTFNGGSATLVVPELAGTSGSVFFEPDGIDLYVGAINQNLSTFPTRLIVQGVFNGASQLEIVELGDEIVPGGVSGSSFGGSSSFFTAPGNTGTAFVAFQTAGADQNVGYFQISFQGTPDNDLTTPGDLTFIGGRFGSGGESLTVGVPEPSTAVGLAALALGAVGVRRRRETAEATAA